MNEPCVICCPEDQIPDAIKDVTLELRAGFPADVLKKFPTDIYQEGRKVCWNCAGRGWVTALGPYESEKE